MLSGSAEYRTEIGYYSTLSSPVSVKHVGRAIDRRAGHPTGHEIIGKHGECAY